MYHNDSAMADLLHCFFATCESGFRFLEEEHGYRYLSGLVEYKNNYQVIMPFHDQALGDDFLALTRYEKDDTSFEILFSSDHFSLEGYVYFDPVQRFELSEVLLAAKKSHDYVPVQVGLTKAEIVEKSLSDMSNMMRDHIAFYLDAGEKVINRALKIRHKRLEQAVRKQFQMQLEFVCKQASKAFLDKDYKEVVGLLQPLELYLAASDLKKLKLSRKYLLS